MSVPYAAIALASAATLAVISTTAVRQADACSFAPDELHVTAPNPDDLSPPSQLAIADVAVYRGIPDCGESGTSCDDIGSVQITIEPPIDDLTAVAQMGYSLRVVSGTPPEGIFELFETPIRLLVKDQIFLRFVDGTERSQEAFDFELGVTAIDLAGNRGDEVIVSISDPGFEDGCDTNPPGPFPFGDGDAGCAVSRGSGPGWALVVVLALLATVRRRQRGA